jgi:hypothetical protein
MPQTPQSRVDFRVWARHLFHPSKYPSSTEVNNHRIELTLKVSPTLPTSVAETRHTMHIPPERARQC